MKSIKDIEYICSAENFLKVKRALNEIGLKLSECEYKLFLDCNKAVKLAEQEV